MWDLPRLAQLLVWRYSAPVKITPKLSLYSNKGLNPRTGIVSELQTTSTEQPSVPGKAQHQQHPWLVLQDVHFGYTGEREVVGGVSLTVEPGQSVALVGPSGSGKSTILKLLMRLYDVNSGSILLDGIDTRDLQQVPLCQEPLLMQEWESGCGFPG